MFNFSLIKTLIFIVIIYKQETDNIKNIKGFTLLTFNCTFREKTVKY